MTTEVGYLVAPLRQRGLIAERLLCGMDVSDGVPWNPDGQGALDEPHAFCLLAEGELIEVEAAGLMVSLCTIPGVAQLLVGWRTGHYRWPM